MWQSSSNNVTSVAGVSAQLVLWKLNYIKKGAHVSTCPPLLVRFKKKNSSFFELSNHHRQNTVTAKFQEEKTLKRAEIKFKTAVLCCL